MLVFRLFQKKHTILFEEDDMVSKNCVAPWQGVVYRRNLLPLVQMQILSHET